MTWGSALPDIMTITEEHVAFCNLSGLDFYDVRNLKWQYVIFDEPATVVTCEWKRVLKSKADIAKV